MLNGRREDFVEFDALKVTLTAKTRRWLVVNVRKLRLPTPQNDLKRNKKTTDLAFTLQTTFAGTPTIKITQ